MLGVRAMTMKVQAVGMAWYKRKHYTRLLEIFEDSDKLHRTYDEWLVAAEQGCKGLEAKGVRVIRVDIDPDEFPSWCASKGLNLNANARIEYSNWRAVLAIRESSSHGGS